MKKTMRKLMVCSALVLVATSTVAQASDLRPAADRQSGFILVANNEEGAKQFIAKMGDRGLSFLSNSKISQEAKTAEFSKLLNDSFDMNTIGRFTLGTHWRTATPAQQQEYLKLFKNMIVKVYSKRFSEYQGQKFDVRTARKENDTDSIVSSYIVPASGPEVRVDWRVRNKGGSYKVVDIMVEGVSMAMTQRADFSSVIQRGGGKVDVLLDHLRKI